jgi:hypothetical protein
MAEHAMGLAPNRYDADMDATRPKRVRVTVSLSPERLERARKRVEWGKVSSISAWVEEALIHHEGQFGWDPNALQEMFDEFDRMYGPPSKEAEAWAERVVDRILNGP